MRIGVTGGTGFIGQYLIRDYGEKYEFIVPVRKKYNVKDNGSYIQSDYCVESLKKIFEGCDVVIHLAAKGMPKTQAQLRMSDYIENIVCANCVLEACKDLGIAKVICISSKAIWSGISSKQKLFFKEDDIAYPGDEYGVSKQCVEELVNLYRNVYGMNIIIYRMAEVCGIDLNRGMLNPFWAAVLSAVVENRSVPIYGKGIGGRDLVYVKDVTRALDIGICKDVRGTFHIGSGYITTNMEIAKTFCAVFEDEAGIRIYPEKREWGTRQCLNVNKARKEIGYKTIYGLNELVQDIKEEYIGFSKGKRLG